MKIGVVGDSWAAGEWPDPGWGSEWEPMHKGLQQYLVDNNHEVVDCARPGWSNLNILNDIQKNHLKELQSCDYVLWIQTDPLRDFKTEQLWWPTQTVDDVYKRQNKHLKNFYTQLNDLGLTVHLIGGLCKIQTKGIKKYKNIRIAVPSIVELLTGKKQWDIYYQNYYQYLTPKNSTKEVVDHAYLQDRVFWDIMADKKWFYPDGVHPNREGHKVLYEYLKNNVLFE